MVTAELSWPAGDWPPKDISFRHTIPNSIRESLCGLLPASIGEQIAAIHAITAPDSLVGRYQLEMQERPSLFMRVTSRIGDGITEKALVSHAAAKGVSVLPYIHLDVVDTEQGQLRIDIRNFREGRHPTREDAARIGFELRQLHEAVLDFPRLGTVRQNAENRFARLEEYSRGLRNGKIPTLPDDLASWFWTHREWVIACAEELSPLAIAQMKDAQCIHGEPTPANLLLYQSQPILIDFEESTQIFAPPLWDMATLIQRLLLFGSTSIFESGGRIAQFEEGFGCQMKGVATMMRHVSWSTLMMVLDYATKGVYSSIGECEKFYRLERHAVMLATAFPEYS